MNWKLLGTLVTLIGVGASVALGQGTTQTIVDASYITNVFGQSNFIKNPNAKLNATTVACPNTTAPICTTTASVTQSKTTPLVATSEFQVTTSSTTGLIDWNTRAFDAGMKGQNCEARFTYKGFSTGSTKAQIVQGSNVVAELALTSTTDPKIASINFPCGDLSQVTKFRLQQATASLTGINEIGGIYVGLATNMANVAQAETVVNAVMAANQTIAFSGTVIWGTEQLDVYNEFDPTTGIFTAKRAGNYQVEAQVLYDTASWTAAWVHDLGVYFNGVRRGGSRITVEATNTEYVYNYAFVTYSLNAGEQIDVRANISGSAITSKTLLAGTDFQRLTIKRFPSSSELVVTPERQNTWAGIRAYSGGDSNNVTTGTVTKLTSAGTLTRETFGKALVETNNDYSITIKNMPVGYYQVLAQGWLFAVSSASGVQTQCVFTISDSATAGTTLGGFVSNSYGDATQPVQQASSSVITGVYYNSSVADRTFYVRAAKSLGNACKGYTDQASTPLVMTVTPLDQPSNSALYVEGPVKASATGAVIPSGYVFEELTGTVTANTNLTTATGFKVAEITLQPGVYLLHGRAYISPSSTIGAWRVALFQSSASVGTDFVSGIDTNVGTDAGKEQMKIVRITTPTTWYLNEIVYFSAGTVSHSAANSFLKAYRLN